MPSIGVATLIWQRPEIWEIVKSCLNEYDLTISVSGSEGKVSKSRSEGCIYTEIKNMPLGRKANMSVKALKGKVDYVIMLGSDDVFCPKMMDLYLDSIEKEYDFVGFKDCYFMNVHTLQTIYWAGYRGKRKNEPIGAFKMISARLLDQIDWMPFANGRTASLDNSFHEKIKDINKKSILYSMKTSKVVGLDIKQNDNLSKFRLWDNAKFIKHEEMKALTQYDSIIEYHNQLKNGNK